MSVRGPGKPAKLPAVHTLMELRGLARTNEKYRQLLHLASRNLGGPFTDNDDVAYRWLETNALETDEDGVVAEVNFCRDLVK